MGKTTHILTTKRKLILSVQCKAPSISLDESNPKHSGVAERPPKKNTKDNKEIEGDNDQTDRGISYQGS
jgi:hypothetical protein